MDPDDLAFWYPLLVDTKVLTPATHFLKTPDLVPKLVGEEEIPGYARFLGILAKFGDRVGWPCVLRTGFGVNRHNWLYTGLVQRSDDLDNHVHALAYWSRRCGLPASTWAVRQYVPVSNSFHAFRGTPIGREFRVFVRNGEVQCFHPYWPMMALEIGKPDAHDWVQRYATISELGPNERRVMLHLSAHVSRSIPGEWAIDWAQLEDGRWVCMDMNTAGLAWHWPGCAHHPDDPHKQMAASISPTSYQIRHDAKEDLQVVLELERCLEQDGVIVAVKQ